MHSTLGTATRLGRTTAHVPCLGDSKGRGQSAELLVAVAGSRKLKGRGWRGGGRRGMGVEGDGGRDETWKRREG